MLASLVGYHYKLLVAQNRIWSVCIMSVGKEMKHPKICVVAK